MTPPNIWGPPIWTFFHVLAEKINEKMYPSYRIQLLNIIKTICSALPCPECSQDASMFLAKIKLQTLNTKDDFKNMLYFFHNYVNTKKRKPLYKFSDLAIYKKYNIIYVFNRFISVYHTRGNMKLLAESFQRQNIVKSIRGWFTTNIFAFMSTPEPVTTEEAPVTEEAPGTPEEAVTEETPVTTEEPVTEETPVTTEEPVTEEPVTEEVVNEEVTSEDTSEQIVSEEQVVVENNVKSKKGKKKRS